MTTPTTPSDRENVEWIESFESGRKWLNKLSVRKSGSVSTRNYYCRAMREFSEFVGKDPDEIIGEYKTDIKDDLEEAMEKWSDLLDSFAVHLMKRVKKSTTAVYHAAVKSFFKYNSKIDLKAPTPNYYSERVPGVSFEELKQLDALAGVQQRFFLRFLKDTGISRSDVVRLNYSDVRKEFEEGKEIIHIEMLRGKEKVEYDTFIGPNTTEALKAYLILRRARGEEITDKSPLFAAETATYHRLSPAGLSAVFKRLSEKSGVKVTPHRLRKFFETYLALAKVHPVILKYWIGHKVGKGKKDVEMRYIIPPLNEQRKLYTEAYQKIDLVPKIDEFELWKASVEAKMSFMSAGEQEEFLERLIKSKNAKLRSHATHFKKMREEEKVELRKRLKEAKTETNGGNCANGNYQRIVSEEELPSLLAEGWKFIATLPSGKVVVSSD